MKSAKLNKLPKELENKFPEELKKFREFYFSLPEEEREKLGKKEEIKSYSDEPEWMKILRQIMKEAKEKKSGKDTGKKDFKYCFECGEEIKPSNRNLTNSLILSYNHRRQRNI